jgi:hypothetical protein
MLRTTLKSIVAVGVCLGGFHSSAVVAQEGEPAVSEDVMEIQMAVDDESGAGPIVISSSRMAFSDDPEGGESSFQIFTGNDIGGDWMPNGGAIDPLTLLDNESVREELELVGDQLDKYKDAQTQLREEIGEKAKSLAGGRLSPAEMGEVAKEIAELQKGRQTKLESMLLPHQLERLKQVAVQIQMKKRGAANTLLSDQMTEELGIDEAQKKRIEERQKELKKELADRMAELKEEIRDKLLAELTSEQKAKLEELSGDDFDYKPTDFRKQIQERINRRVKQRVGG